jgi:GTP-binding protein
VVTFDDEDFVVADIPGVIEGAHKGTGLGHRFLRHITRSAVLVIVLDGQRLIEKDGEKLLIDSYETLRRELKLYSTEVYKKDFVITINKIDLVSDRKILEGVSSKLSKSGKKVLNISAATGEGIREFIEDIYQRVKASREDALSKGKVREEKKKEKVYTIPGEELEKRKIIIKKTPGGFIVKNRQLERMVAMTDLENEEALDYLMYRFRKMKVGDRLKELGIDEGNTVIIGNLVFELVD